MASKMIGRTACPECGFASAHVKQSDKCVYRYCPECQAQHHARTERQRADLMAKTRLIDPPAAAPTATATGTAEPAVEVPAAAVTPTPTEPTRREAEAPAPTPTATAPRRRVGLFSF